MTRILVVDDVKLFRHHESSVLGWRGYAIEEASGGVEALAAIRANPPDLILLDLHMPDLSGTEVCRQLKSDPALRSLPVIVVTSSSRDEDIRAAVQAGCDDFLTKPIDDATLVRKVEDLLGNPAKRRYPRVSASMQVSFEDFKGIFFEYARDISRSGVFIEMAEPLPVGARLRLSFGMPPPFHHPVLAYGRVVRSMPPTSDRPGGVGVSFIHLEEDSLQVIDALVAGQAPPGEPTTDGAFSRLEVQLDGASPQEGAEQRLAATVVERDEAQGALAELRRDHLRLSALLALEQALLAVGSPRQALETAGHALENLIGVNAWAILLYAKDRLRPVAFAGLAAPVAEHLPLAGPIAEAVRLQRLQLPSPPWPVEGTGLQLLAAVPLPGSDPASPALGVATLHSLHRQKLNLSLADDELLTHLGLALAEALRNTTSRVHAGIVGADEIFKALGI